MADINILSGIPDGFSQQDKECVDKIFGALGLALRARKLVCGRELCIEQMKKGKAVMAFFPEDVSENARKEMLHAFDKSSTPYIALPVKMADMSKRLGKTSSVSCAVITENGFDKIIYKLLGVSPIQSHD